MKFRYDKTSSKVVEKPEPGAPPPFESFPVSAELKEQIESMQAMQTALHKVFG